MVNIGFLKPYTVAIFFWSGLQVAASAPFEGFKIAMVSVRSLLRSVISIPDAIASVSPSALQSSEYEVPVWVSRSFSARRVADGLGDGIVVAAGTVLTGPPHATINDP
jgi:hypothetical protein